MFKQRHRIASFKVRSVDLSKDHRKLQRTHSQPIKITESTNALLRLEKQCLRSIRISRIGQPIIGSAVKQSALVAQPVQCGEGRAISRDSEIHQCGHRFAQRIRMAFKFHGRGSWLPEGRSRCSCVILRGVLRCSMLRGVHSLLNRARVSDGIARFEQPPKAPGK
jgi:hypothetical protein